LEPKVASAFIMPCGFCPACGAGRDDLCDNFFAMNRLKGTLYDGHVAVTSQGRLAHRHVFDGRPREYAVVPATDVFPLIDGLPLEESPCWAARSSPRMARSVTAPSCAAASASRWSPPRGVGINIIQIAKAFGASQIIAVDIRDDKLEAAKRLGATDVINATATDVGARVRELTDGKGVDVAFEVLGLPQTFTQAFEIIRDGGRMVASASRPARPQHRSRSRDSSVANCASLVHTAPAHVAICRRSSASPRRAFSGRDDGDAAVLPR
jgi:S-(hydroxymethyl)glutathione dehydrogenase/alcohol dehydrogenase